LKITYTHEAIADIVDACACLNGQRAGAAVQVDAAIADCFERLAAREFDGPVTRLQSGETVRSWPVPPFRIY